ncbi:N-acetyltransferase [Clostridium thermarum]|uniref:N-acetyltransferase n=1 Tax=Clostridium thermarum TaxID=1716543 RepID=UPI0013D65336|nr:N-acetyltransferase [Clostridium thermarum]
MIKQLNNSHINKVMDIWLKSNIIAHHFIPEDYWLKNYELVKSEYIPISKTFVYEEEDELKGFISIINGSFIGALFVSEAYQGQGIGKKLLNYCKQLYPSLDLCVYEDNINAVEFYKAGGFEVVRQQLNEDSGFKEYLMRWTR